MTLAANLNNVIIIFKIISALAFEEKLVAFFFVFTILKLQMTNLF